MGQDPKRRGVVARARNDDGDDDDEWGVADEWTPTGGIDDVGDDDDDGSSLWELARGCCCFKLVDWHILDFGRNQSK